MTPAPVDIDKSKVLHHIHARRRGIVRYIRNLVLLFVGALLVGAIAGHLMEVLAPVQPWSPPGITTTPFPNGDTR